MSGMAPPGLTRADLPSAVVTAPPIGALREKFFVQRAKDDPSPDGGLTRSYQTLALIWASVEPLDGHLTLAGRDVAAATGAETTQLRLLTRYSLFLAEADRIDTILYWRRRRERWRIHRVADLAHRGRFLALDCTLLERVAPSVP
ncbi:head-tail adaptor protein [Elstera cyanobacteriorum]|uniref:phage head completion protein n=1 Tax=Elstera cyanobacteriorum TaxID=2022747 RepID=UPI0023533375|nr:head-tail adaptor protein [Elstera cyanobacteriorum]MCK6444563.1 head-tail adaptor protein [Elstera cyanobacteriorum]